MRRVTTITPVVGLSIAVLLQGCNPVPGAAASNGVGTSAGKVASMGKVALVVNAVNFSQASRRTQSVTATNTNNGMADSILSTAPEQMVVYLQSISGVGSGSMGVPFWMAPASGGVAISLQSGNVDLGALNLGQIAAAAGSYEGVRLQFARVGQIKGAVTGTFGQNTTAGTGAFVGSPAAGAANQYTNEAVHSGQTETFCTRSDKSELSAETFGTTLIGHNADFDPALNQKTDSELTDVDLEGGNDQNLSIAQIRQASITVESTGSFAVAENATTTLTLAVDLNRMLRFYANTRSDHQPPNPGMKAGTSYFFTTLFPSSISVFGGTVGSVQGYQITANAVNAWMTLFLDSSGKVLSATVMPDDDNALTIMKGNGSVRTGQLDTGLGIDLGISNSTISGFKGVALNASGSATLTINQTSGNGIPAGTHYDLSYQRLL